VDKQKNSHKKEAAGQRTGLFEVQQLLFIHMEKELCCIVGKLPDSIFLSKENKIDYFKNAGGIYYQKENIPDQLSASGSVPKGYAFPDNRPGYYYIENGAIWL
jgi:hypothetical protein